MTIGEQLKILRTEKGLTQTELAKRTGMSVTEINHIETEKHIPTALTIAKLSRALDCDYEIFWKLR